MKIIAALFAAALLVAGCSGSDSDEPAPEKASEPTDASKALDRESFNRQAKDQAEQLEEAQKQLEKDVEREAEKKRGVVIDVGLYSGRKPTPQGDRVEAKVGQKITLRVTSATDEELHVHSDPEHTFAVKPGKDQLFSFTIDRPGQVAVEAHHAGVTLVQLVVRP